MAPPAGPDWSEHAVTIVALLAALAAGAIGLAAKLAWTRIEGRASDLAASLDRIAASLQAVGLRIDNISERWAQRMEGLEIRMASVENLCRERHGSGRREEDVRRAKLEEALDRFDRDER